MPRCRERQHDQIEDIYQIEQQKIKNQCPELMDITVTPVLDNQEGQSKQQRRNRKGHKRIGNRKKIGFKHSSPAVKI
ncbi:hypothetical protein D3C80_2097700 [compost metagenome]